MKPNENTWAWLALCRFLLASLVVVHHVSCFVSPDRAPVYGFYAVIGFMAISGYSIGWSIRERPEGFLVRRAWRILPVYWACWLIAVCVRMVSPVAAVGQFLMLQCFAVTAIGAFVPAWSLSVECALYALAPRLSKSSNKMILGALLVSLCAFCLACLTGNRPDPHQMFGLPLLLLGWAWLAGFLASRAVAWPLILLPASVLFDMRYGGALVVAVPAALIVVAYRLPLKDRPRKVFSRLGDLSFPLYLVHFPILEVLKSNGVLNYASELLVALLASVAIYYCADIPARALRKHLSPAKRQNLETGYHLETPSLSSVSAP